MTPEEMRKSVAEMKEYLEAQDAQRSARQREIKEKMLAIGINYNLTAREVEEFSDLKGKKR